MGVSIRDRWAAVFVALAVLTYVAAAESWNVWLVGDSNRWAAGVIGVLGIAACSLGRPSTGTASKLLSVLGVATLAALVVALLTASGTALALLVLGDVTLWVASALRHTGARPATHIP